MPSGLPDPEKSRAVLIGMPDYVELEPLPAVASNVRRLKELLGEPDLWGLPEANCTIIVGDDDPRTIPRAIRAAAQAAEDLLLVYYAGHGLLPPDSDKFCLALPSSSTDYTDTAVRYEDVRGAVACARPGSGRAVILDCCFAARAFAGGMSAPPGFAELTQIDGACMLTACDETTLALAPPGETYTAFTGELLGAIESGLMGAPALLDLETLYRHLCGALEAKSRPRPQFFSRGAGRALCLARNRGYVPADATAAAGLNGPIALPDGVMDLAHAQLRAADDFPYRLVGARRSSLSAVYVRQDVAESLADRQHADLPAVPAADRTTRESRPVPAAAGPPAAVTSARTVEDALAVHRHVVIIGGPGQGKSSLTLQLAGQLAHDLLRDRSRPMPDEPVTIPVRVTAAALTARRGPLFQRIGDAAATELSLHLDTQLPRRLLQRLPGAWTWLIIVDGLDEITDPEQRTTLIQQLAARTREDEPGLRLLITTRPLPEPELEPFRSAVVGQYQLEAFSRERLRDFAYRWFGEREPEPSRAAEFLHRVQQAGPSELVRVPLLATIAAIVFEQQPAAELPGNRYVLYQSYLSYLQAARAEATSEQWRHIRNRVRNIPGAGTRPLDYLRGHLPELVKQLAEAAVGGDSDLGQRAPSWIEQHSGRSMPAVPDWAGLVAGLLSSTGLFVHTGGGQRFVHHSFAEHLAAQAMAERLPADFDHNAPAFVDVLKKALARDQIAVIALVHHTHDHPSAEGILNWLEHGEGDHGQLVGVLLAEGIRTWSYAAHAERFLEFFREWLGQRSGRGRDSRDLWDVVSRLSDQATLDFLQQLAEDPLRPADDRIRAAEALPPAAMDCAVAALRGVVAAVDTGFSDRCTAAAALAELGSDHAAEAAAVFRDVIESPASRNFERGQAAAHLADLEPGYLEEAAAALREIISSPHATPGDRVGAADDLAELDPAYSAEAVAVLRETIGSPQAGLDDRASAAGYLGRLGAEYVAEAAGVLGEIAASPRIAPGDRASAARRLGGLGAEYVAEAAGVLREIAASPRIAPGDRASAADDLAVLGEGYAGEAAAVLREIIASEQVGADDHVKAARWLAGLGPAYTQEVVTALRDIISGPISDAGDRAWAAASLGRLGPGYANEAAAVLREIITGAPSSYNRSYAAGMLAELGTGYMEEAAAILRGMSAEPTRESAYAASTLGGLGSGYREEAAASLRMTMALPAVPMSDRIYAAGSLVWLGQGCAAEATTMLREIIGSAQVSPYDRVAAAQSLGQLGTSDRALAAAALREVIASPLSAADDRASAAEELGELSPGYDAEAAAVLREIIASVPIAPDDRISAARALGGLSPEHIGEAASALREIIGSAQVLPGDQASAAGTLASLQTDYLDEAVAVLRQILASRSVAANGRITAASELGGLALGYIEEAAAALRDVISSSETSPYRRADAASSLARLGPAYVGEAVTTLQEAGAMLDGSTAHWTPVTRWLSGPGSREDSEGARILKGMIFEADNAAACSLVARWLAGLGPAYADEGVQRIRAIIASPATSPYARASAADDLAWLGWRYAGEAAGTLREVMNSPQTGPADRAAAARWLADISPDHVPEAVQVLRGVISGDDSTPFDRASAARWLGKTRVDYAEEAVAVLDALLASPQSIVGQGFAALCLAEVMPARLTEALQLLRSLMSSPQHAPTDRCLVAVLLTDVNPGLTGEAINTIRECHGQSEGSVADRMLAAVLLSAASPECTAEAEGILRDLLSSPWVSDSERDEISQVQVGLADGFTGPSNMHSDLWLYQLDLNFTGYSPGTLAAARMRPAGWESCTTVRPVNTAREWPTPADQAHRRQQQPAVD